MDPLWTPKKACKGADTALLTSLPTFPNKSDLKCLGLDFYFFRILLDLYRDVLRQKLLRERGKPAAGARSIEPFQVSGWRGDREAMGFQCSGSMRTWKNGRCEQGDLEESNVKNGRMR